MNEEIEAIEKNQTREFVDLSKDKKAIGVKWLYKAKKNEKGEVTRHKDILVAKQYNQNT